MRAALAYASAAGVLLLTRYAPDFRALGPNGALFGWLAFVTAVTALVPVGVLAVGLRGPFSASDRQVFDLQAFGLGFGRSRRDALWIALAVAGAVVVAAVVSRAPEVRAYYPRLQLVKTEPLWWIPSTLAFAAYGLSWETLFRGHLLIGVIHRLGAWAIVAQTVPFAIAHIDKPPLEMALSIPGGLFFGAVAYRTRSVLPGFLVHFTLSTSVNLLCAYG